MHKLRKFLAQLVFGPAGREIAEDLANCDTRAANTWLSESNVGIDGNAAEEIHTV